MCEFLAPSPCVCLISLAFESSDLVKTKWLCSTALSRAAMAELWAWSGPYHRTHCCELDGDQAFLSLVQKQTGRSNPTYQPGNLTEKLTLGQKGSTCHLKLSLSTCHLSSWDTWGWRLMVSVCLKISTADVWEKKTETRRGCAKCLFHFKRI